MELSFFYFGHLIIQLTYILFRMNKKELHSAAPKKSFFYSESSDGIIIGYLRHLFRINSLDLRNFFAS